MLLFVCQADIQSLSSTRSWRGPSHHPKWQEGSSPEVSKQSVVGRAICCWGGMDDDSTLQLWSGWRPRVMLTWHPNGSVYHQRAWLRGCKASYSGDDRYLMKDDIMLNVRLFCCQWWYSDLL